MKLEPFRIGAFLRDPGNIRCILLHGDDAGLIRERGNQLRRSITAITADDPFRIAELDRARIAELGDEIAALPLTGGRRVVHVREAGDFAFEAVRRVLARPGEGVVVLEAPDLPPRSRLRSLIEESREAVAIACYPESGRALRAAILDCLHGVGVTIEDAALEWLVGHLGGDRAIIRQEVEKLAQYVGVGGHVDFGSARACVGDEGGLVIEDALFAATLGNVAAADRAVQLALAEGASPVRIVRAALMHVQRLARARANVDGGKSFAEATGLVRPPLFRGRSTSFEQALRRWSSGALAMSAVRLSELELACKRGSPPPELLARYAVNGLARRVGAPRRDDDRRISSS